MLLPTPLAQDEALHALAEIRSVIDRSARYSTFSALSGLLAGVAALVGSGGCGLMVGFPGARPENGLPFVLVWAVVFVAAAVSLAVLTTMKARQRGEPVWTPIARTAASALVGPGLAGLAASMVLVQTGRFELLAGVWLLLYGCGFWSVSFFAPLFLRWLGGGFMILGMAAWMRPEQSALCLGLGFGLLHLVFAVIVLARYQK
ncbi:MAG TPA: hypothetical protein VGP72_26825 [Planctomycetota bacterium]